MRESLKAAVIVLVICVALVWAARYFQLEQRVFGYSVTDYSYAQLEKNAKKIPEMLDKMLDSIRGGKKKPYGAQ